MEYESHFITVLRSLSHTWYHFYRVLSHFVSSSPPRFPLQVLVWPQLLSPLCSPRTTMCSWAGHFTICSTRSEQPSPGSPATTPGMLLETVPAVSLATALTCSPPANSSSSENSSLHFRRQKYTMHLCIYAFYGPTPAVFFMCYIYWRKQMWVSHEKAIFGQVSFFLLRFLYLFLCAVFSMVWNAWG